MGFDPDTWARDVPYGASPPSRAAGAAEAAFAAASPQSVAAYQREETRGGYTGGFKRQSPSTSPRVPYRSPGQQAIPGQTIASYTPTSPRGRPVSMPSQHPEPHMLHHQPFKAYGAREVGGGYKSRSTSRRSPDKDFLVFDAIPSTVDDASTTGDLALLMAAEESLHVFKVDKDGIHRHGYIEGLRGQVISAKILPIAIRQDHLRLQRPLVGVVVHGLMASPSNVGDSQHSEFDPSDSMLQAMQAVPGQLYPPKYQTSVEVYSLKDRCHIATLYKSPPLDEEIPPDERYSEPPPPFGALNIQARGRFVIVTSATSGEVYIYEAVKANPHRAFRCIGKTWTAIQGKKSKTWSSSSAGPLEKDVSNDLPPNVRAPTDIALVSLSSRWLALVPPVAGSKSTLHGIVDSSVASARSPPGVRSHTSPSQPYATCELDTPLEDSRFNKVARDVTQEVLKGARWVGDQGLQAWKNYWNKPEGTQTQESGLPTIPQQQFPPTHADENVKATQHPTLVSILDLEKLSETQDGKADSALHPLATFPLADGCSFLSFGPSGLGLLTATAKGDVCYVWDLMRMVYWKSMNSSQDTSDRTKPFVRQVARFARVTIANVVDVVWAEPKGERLAIVTDRGTVHVHDIPHSSFQWPLPLRPKRPLPPRKRSSDVAPLQPGGFAGAFSAVSGSAQPIFAAVRGTGLPNLGGFNLSSAGAGAGVKTGRVVSTGLSKSMGAASGTVDSLLRMGDSRMHLPGSARANTVGSTRWLHAKDTIAIAVVGGGFLRMHSILSNSDVKAKKRHSVVGLQLADFSVPKLKAPGTMAHENGVTLGGYWPDAPVILRVPRSAAQPISYAELETSAPYQPFHTDKRVNLNVYDHVDHHLDDHEPWVFGEEIATTQVVSGLEEESDDAQLGPEASAPMDNLNLGEMVDLGDLLEDEPEAEVVMTTVRKKKKGKRTKGSGEERLPEREDERFEGSVMIDFVRERV